MELMSQKWLPVLRVFPPQAALAQTIHYRPWALRFVNGTTVSTLLTRGDTGTAQAAPFPPNGHPAVLPH